MARSHRAPRVIATTLLCLLLPVAGHAIVVDGVLDSGYTQFALQGSQTGQPESTFGTPDFCDGSELDAAYATITGGTLYLFFAGNLRDVVRGSQAGTDLDVLEI